MIRAFFVSGWQDSNLRPSAPKADALTGLRYTPKIFNILFLIKQDLNLRPSRQPFVGALLTGLCYTPKICGERDYSLLKSLMSSSIPPRFESPVPFCRYDSLASGNCRISHSPISRTSRISCEK